MRRSGGHLVGAAESVRAPGRADPGGGGGRVGRVGRVPHDSAGCHNEVGCACRLAPRLTRRVLAPPLLPTSTYVHSAIVPSFFEIPESLQARPRGWHLWLGRLVWSTVLVVVLLFPYNSSWKMLT